MWTLTPSRNLGFLYVASLCHPRPTMLFTGTYASVLGAPGLDVPHASMAIRVQSRTQSERQAPGFAWKGNESQTPLRYRSLSPRHLPAVPGSHWFLLAGEGGMFCQLRSEIAHIRGQRARETCGAVQPSICGRHVPLVFRVEERPIRLHSYFPLENTSLSPPRTWGL